MTASPSAMTRDIAARAGELGFDAVGVARADFLDQDHEALTRWIEAKAHGGMAYMAREPRRRSDPREVLPGARSVIVLGMSYGPNASPVPPGPRPSGRVARYAWGLDYHPVIEKRLARLEAFVREVGGPQTACRSYVDHGPVLEKALARRSGIGFIGKNTLLIHEALGSWLFLAVILTTLDLDPGEAQTSQCGSCRACLEACPTGALTAPFQLDANRCIAYLTIEHKGEIPEGLKPEMKGWVFGCDICQEVCPYNAPGHAGAARPKPSPLPEFHPESGVGPCLALEALMAIETDEAFRAAFHGTPLLRPKRTGLQRNAKALMDYTDVRP